MTAVDTTPIQFEETINEKDYSLDQTQEDILANQEASIKLVNKLRASPEEWDEVIAYEYLSASAREHSLTATTLRGENMIARRPTKFFNKDKSHCVMAMHFGANLCGHDGVIHGGLAATVLDEMLAYVTIPTLPNKSGFTANLNVNYRRPILSNQWVIIHGELEKQEGRKAWGKAWIETIDEEPIILTEATALYISPKTPGPVTDF